MNLWPKPDFIFSHQGFRVKMEAVPRVICRAHSTVFLIMPSETIIEQKKPIRSAYAFKT